MFVPSQATENTKAGLSQNLLVTKANKFFNNEIGTPNKQHRNKESFASKKTPQSTLRKFEAKATPMVHNE